MSQRGMRLIQALRLVSRLVWGPTLIIVSLTMGLLCGTTLVLSAQAPTAQDPIKQMPAQSAPKSVTIRVDGAVHQVHTTLDTVKAVLQQEQITLNTYDKCTPPVNAPVADGMAILIVRVTCERVKERVTVPAPTITRFSSRITAGPVVLSQGKAGLVERTQVLWRKDGVLATQWTESQRVLVKPVATIVARGIAAPSRGFGGRRVLSMVATAYDPSPASCGPGARGYTAIGMRAGRGIIAVDPRVIPLGSRVYVEGYGAAIAGDTGGAIRGNRIDVCFPTRSEAIRWGRRTVKVIVEK